MIQGSYSSAVEWSANQSTMRNMTWFMIHIGGNPETATDAQLHRLSTQGHSLQILGFCVPKQCEIRSAPSQDFSKKPLKAFKGRSMPLRAPDQSQVRFPELRSARILSPFGDGERELKPELSRRCQVCSFGPRPTH